MKDGIVEDWIHKSFRPENYIVEDKHKTVNIHSFSEEFVRDVLKPTLSSHMNSGDQDKPMEYVMHDIVKYKKQKIQAFEASDYKWYEIDDEKDLKMAEEKFLEKPSMDKVRSYYGGYWRSTHIDFHYLFNHHFPTKKFYEDLAKRLPILGNYYPSSQKRITELMAKWKDDDYFVADNLVVTNGSSEAIRMLNDHVITKATVPLPTFNEFTRTSPDKIHKYTLSEEDNFTLDVEKLIDEAKKSGSEYVVIINPNNPVGNLTSLEDIEKILKSGLKLVIDEAFIAYAGPNSSAEKLVVKYDNLVVITSCTKSIGIAGLRLGYMITTNEEIKKKMREHLPIWNINSITECLIEIFPKYREEHAESLVTSREDTRRFFNQLNEIDYLEPFPTHANAVFCRVRGNARRLSEILYDKYDLMVKDGLPQKENNAPNYIRLGVRNKVDNDKLFSALKTVSKADIN